MPRPSIDLDEKDMTILEILQEDGRIALAELGRRVGLSQPAMSERVKRLEESGIIAGYGARIDRDALGLGMMAIIRLKTAHEHIAACLKRFSDLPYICEIHRVTGEDCFVLKAIVPTPGDLATIVDAIGRYGPVTTSVVLRSEANRIISRDLIRAARR